MECWELCVGLRDGAVIGDGRKCNMEHNGSVCFIDQERRYMQGLSHALGRGKMRSKF
jgi:hypothetical protein